jgi:hypothetical protein
MRKIVRINASEPNEILREVRALNRMYFMSFQPYFRVMYVPIMLVKYDRLNIRMIHYI